MLVIDIFAAIRIIFEIPAEKSRNISCSIEAGEIGQTGVHDGCFEPVSLSHGQGSHITTAAKSADCQLSGIGDSLLNQVINSGHDIFEIASAPVRKIQFCKF